MWSAGLVLTPPCFYDGLAVERALGGLDGPDAETASKANLTLQLDKAATAAGVWPGISAGVGRKSEGRGGGGRLEVRREPQLVRACALGSTFLCI